MKLGNECKDEDMDGVRGEEEGGDGCERRGWNSIKINAFVRTVSVLPVIWVFVS